MQLLALSARTSEELAARAGRLRDHVREHPEVALPDLCAALDAAADRGPARLALVVASAEELHDQLGAFAGGEKRREHLTGYVDGGRPRVAFLCTGQGSQYPGMAKQLYDALPAFKQALDCCAELVQASLPQPLLSVVYPEGNEPTPLHETAYTQPALFAIEYALASVWRSWGVRPDGVLGHSVGEYTAACLAEMFDLGDGLRLIALRGRLMQQRPANGSMAVVFADEAQVRRAIEPYQDTVSIAAINGPRNTVISGLRETVAMLVALFASQGVNTYQLTVSHAFHSPLMEPVLQPFEQIAGRIRYQHPRIDVVSNLTGTVLPPEHLPDARYWRRHIRATVRFADGIQALWQRGYRVFVELGPDPVLIGMGKKCVPASAATWLPSLEKGQDNVRTMLSALGALYVRGAPIEWSGVTAGDPRAVVLPSDLTEPVFS